MQTYYQIANAPHSLTLGIFQNMSTEEAINYVIDLYENIYQYEYIGEKISDVSQYSYYSTAAPLPNNTIQHLKENAEIVTLSAEEVFYLQHNEALYFIENLEIPFGLLAIETDSELEFSDVQRCFIEGI